MFTFRLEMSESHIDVKCYFTKFTAISSRCKICSNVYKHHNNTTNLRNHLKRKHSEFLNMGLAQNKSQKRLKVINNKGSKEDQDQTQTTTSSLQNDVSTSSLHNDVEKSGKLVNAEKYLITYSIKLLETNLSEATTVTLCDLTDLSEIDALPSFEKSTLKFKQNDIVSAFDEINSFSGKFQLLKNIFLYEMLSARWKNEC